MVNDDRIAPAGKANPRSSSSFWPSRTIALVIEQPAAHLLVAEEDVGRDRQMRAQHDFLMHCVDAEADRLVRIGQRDRLAAPEHLARGARMDASQKLDQRRLAGPVLADDGVDLALART